MRRSHMIRDTGYRVGGKPVYRIATLPAGAGPLAPVREDGQVMAYVATPAGVKSLARMVRLRSPLVTLADSTEAPR
jgi:hypothetical protein